MSDETSEYSTFIIQIMRAILRSHLGFPFDFSFELSPVQTQCLEELVVVLDDKMVSPRKRMMLYHTFAWSLVNRDQENCMVDKSENPIARAIWLLALREDGNFCGASVLEQDLVKLQYFCNITCLLEALMDKDEGKDSVHFDDHE